MSTLGTVAGALAGAIPVVGSVVSSLINTSAVKANNQSNQQFQEQQQQEQEAYNTKQWQMQADYNSPGQQVNRLRAAGLNPNLVYGSGSVSGNVAELPAPAPRVDYQAQAPEVNDFGKAASEGIQAYNQTQSTNASVDNLQALSTNALAQAFLAGTEASRNIAGQPYVAPQAAADVQKTVADAGNLDMDSLLKNAETLNTNWQTQKIQSQLNPEIANMNADTQLKKIQAYTGFAQYQLNEAMNAMNLKQAAVNMLYMTAQTSKSVAEQQQIKALIPQIQASTIFTQLDNAIKAKNIALHSPGWFYTLLQGMNMSGATSLLTGAGAGIGLSVGKSIGSSAPSAIGGFMP